MRYLFYILLLLMFFSCGTVREKENYSPGVYLSLPGKVVSLQEFLPELNYVKIDPVDVKRIRIDVNTFSHPSWWDKALPILNECRNVEFVQIHYPNGWKEDGFTKKLSKAINKMPQLKAIHVAFDTLRTLPKLISKNSNVKAIRFMGKYVDFVPFNILASDSLQYAAFSFSAAKLNCDFSQCPNIESLSIYVNGDVEPPNLNSQNLLRTLSYSNDQIEELPDNFFGASELKALSIHAPKLKRLNTRLGSLKSLESLTLTTYELEQLPDFLGDMSTLEELSIESAGKLNSLTPLRKLPHLRSLYIFGVDPIQNIEDIVSIPELKVLCVSIDLLKGQDLSPLRKLKETEIETVEFSSICTTEKDGEFIECPIDDSVRRDLYDELRELLPRKYFKH